MNFKITKNRNQDFILETGVSYEELHSNFPNETKILSTFQISTTGREFLIPRLELCEVLDSCFDHFTEESLVAITKLLSKDSADTELRNQVRERSMSKKKQSNSSKKFIVKEDKNSKEEYEKEQKLRAREEQEKHMREEQEQRMREEQEVRNREEQEQRMREEQEVRNREEQERRIKEEQEVRNREEQERRMREEQERRMREEQERRAREYSKENAIREKIKDRIENKEISRGEHSTHRSKVKENRDLNYDEPIQKMDLLRMIYQFKQQLDVMERYIHNM